MLLGDINIGMVVKLISFDVRMIVTDIDYEEGSAYCFWYDADERPCDRVLPVGLLEAYNRGKVRRERF